LKEYDAGRSEKPAWLEHFENVEKVAKEKNFFPITSIQTTAITSIVLSAS
jgi:hypothetical protein